MDALLLPFVTVAAGMLSFGSPCCLPLLPSYIGYMAGAADGSSGTETRRRTAGRAAGFVGGFSVVFVALGAVAGLFGTTVAAHLPTIVRVSGVVVIAMGLSMIGVAGVPTLRSERRLLAPRRRGNGPGSAALLGATFAAGWSPCMGPVLATVLATAATTGTVAWGAVLLGLYSIGLGIPFIAVALGLQRARTAVAWLRHHGQLVERISGVLLVTIGVLFVAGTWRSLMLPFQRELARLGWPPI